MNVSNKELGLYQQARQDAAITANELAKAVGALDDTVYDDDLLLFTHPADMSEPMLQAVQARINESPEFAKRYREATEYVPLPVIRRRDPETGDLIKRKVKGINF